jgi:hypothetical protein
MPPFCNSMNSCIESTLDTFPLLGSLRRDANTRSFHRLLSLLLRVLAAALKSQKTHLRTEHTSLLLQLCCISEAEPLTTEMLYPETVDIDFVRGTHLHFEHCTKLASERKSCNEIE